MTKYWKAYKDEMIGDMLFDRKETEEVGKMLERMYFKRKRMPIAAPKSAARKPMCGK